VQFKTHLQLLKVATESNRDVHTLMTNTDKPSWWRWVVRRHCCRSISVNVKREFIVVFVRWCPPIAHDVRPCDGCITSRWDLQFAADDLDLTLSHSTFLADGCFGVANCKLLVRRWRRYWMLRLAPTSRATAASSATSTSWLVWECTVSVQALMNMQTDLPPTAVLLQLTITVIKLCYNCIRHEQVNFDSVQISAFYLTEDQIIRCWIITLTHRLTASTDNNQWCQ